MLVFSRTRTPVLLWTHRRFSGLDPWANGTPEIWNIVAYRLIAWPFSMYAIPATQAAPSDSNAVPKKFVMGLAATATGRYRVFPNALQDIWRAGRVRDQELPWLMHQVEQRLWRSDYPSAVVQRLTLGLAVYFGLLALAAVTWYILMAPPMQHVTSYMSTNEWLKAPIQGERSITLQGEMPAAARLILREPAPPPAEFPAAKSLTSVYVVQGPSEKRLVLAADESQTSNLSGTVLRTGPALLPAAMVASLQERFPDLNAGYVLCAGWRWSDAVSPYDGEQYRELWWGAFSLILLTCINLGIYLFWRLRRRAQAKQWMVLCNRRPAAIGA